MRLHIINGTQEMLRAHASMRPRHRSPSGLDLKATAGFIASLVSLIEDPREDVTHIAVAFDRPGRSFRNALFPGYRVATGMTPPLAAQFDAVAAAVAALGVTVWAMDRFEANDALATAAQRWSGQVEQVRLFSADPLVSQCVRDKSVVQVNQGPRRVTTERDVYTRCGCRAVFVPDWVALVGEENHGIPGIPLFGVRSAGPLLEKFGGIEAIPPDVRLWRVARRQSTRMAHALRDRREDAGLYKTLATLAVDAPVGGELADLRWRGADEAQVEAVMRSHGLALPRPRAWRRI